jgi:hypothetical protein
VERKTAKALASTLTAITSIEGTNKMVLAWPPIPEKPMHDVRRCSEAGVTLAPSYRDASHPERDGEPDGGQTPAEEGRRWVRTRDITHPREQARAKRRRHFSLGGLPVRTLDADLPCTWLVHLATIIRNATIAQTVSPNTAAAINAFRIGNSLQAGQRALNRRNCDPDSVRPYVRLTISRDGRAKCLN